MEFLVEFELEIPAGTPLEEVQRGQRAESAAAAKLARRGISFGSGDGRWSVTDQQRSAYTAPTARQSSTACSTRCPSRTGYVSRSRHSRRTERSGRGLAMSNRLPDPSLTLVYRLELFLANRSSSAR